MTDNLNGSIKLTFKNSEIVEDLEEQFFVTMEQEYIPERDQYAGLYDAFRMIQLAQSGGSAFNHNLPGNVTLEGNYFKIELDFYVWPHPETLEFDTPTMVSSSTNYVTPLYKFTTSKTVNKVVPMTNFVQLPYSGVVSSVTWDTSCYNEEGEVLDQKPEMEIKDGYIIFDKVVFGVLKITTQAIGYRYTATIYVAKSVQEIVYNQVNKNQITYPECVVEVSHLDEEGEEQQALLELILPAYVLDYFEGCPVSDESEPKPDPEDPDEPGPEPEPEPGPEPEPDPKHPKDPNPEEPEDLGNLSWYKCFPDEDPIVEIVKVYYSTCSGKVIDTVRTKVHNPCSKDWNI